MKAQGSKKNKNKNKGSNNKLKELTWDALEAEKNELIGMISQQQSFLSGLVKEELTEEELKNNEEFSKSFHGLNKTYLDLLNRTIDISKEHGKVVKTEDVDGIKLDTVECEKGKLNPDSVEELMKYQAIMNKYGEVAFTLNSITTGAMSQLVISIAENKAEKSGNNPEEVKEIDNIKSTIEAFKGTMDAYGLSNIHELVPTPETIKQEYKEAVEKTKKMVESELADIKSKQETNNGNEQQ